MSNELILAQTPYPDVCFSWMVGVRGVCEPKAAAPQFWVDSIPGIDLDKLALAANLDAPTGAKLGQKLLNSAVSFLAADIEAIYAATYRTEANLVSGCSSCKFLNHYSAGPELGTLIKDFTKSNFSSLLLDKLTVLVNSTGTFHVVIDDGSDDNVRVFEHDFVAGREYDFVNLGYVTKKKKVRLYFEEPDVLLAQLSCPSSGSGCGCSGKPRAVSDLVYTGTSGGVEKQQAYGFRPCATITCDSSDLLCFVAKSAPRMVGLALLMKFAELYFKSVPFSTRNNRVVGTNTDDKVDEGKYYAGQYRDRLQGSKSGRGVKDAVSDTLKHLTDVCVVCDTPIRAQWASG